MIVLVNPRATKPRNRRFPLSVMSLGAVLPEGQSWAIVDGNLPGVDVADEVAALIDAHAGTADPVPFVAMTVMPGPQLVSAFPAARRLIHRYGKLPVVSGGSLPS